ncbi:MAG: hypothetical protein JKY96_09355 [Phycisphaerales bacterium]|nr:hypothetical protein [Phycisphaerales bacterium]
MTEQGKTDQVPRFVFSRIAVGIIALVWVLSGTMKALDPAGFIDMIQQHRVIGDMYRGYAMYVGPGEIVLGLVLVFVLGSELRKPFGRAVLVLSLLVIVAFTVYLNMVDPVVLQESGCGCLSDFRIASGIEGSQYFIAMLRNGLLAAMHVIAIVGPIVTMRKMPQINANALA